MGSNPTRVIEWTARCLRLVGPMDKATAYGAVDSGFESQAGLAKMSAHGEEVQSKPRDSSVGRAVDCRVFICFEHRHQLVGGSIPSRETHPL